MRPKTIFWFCALGLTHYIVTLGTLCLSFRSTMDRFDSGRVASIPEKIMAGATDVLSLPLVPLLKFSPIRFSGLSGHIPFLANSALWAAVILSIGIWLRKKEPIQPLQGTPAKAPSSSAEPEGRCS